MHQGFSIQEKSLYRSHPYSRVGTAQERSHPSRSHEKSSTKAACRPNIPVIKFKRVMPHPLKELHSCSEVEQEESIKDRPVQTLSRNFESLDM